MKLPALCAATIVSVFGLVASAAGQSFTDPAPPTTTTPAGLVTGAGRPTYGTPNGGSPVVFGQELFASGGEVLVTDLGPTGASYDEDLFVYTPSTGYGLFMNDHSTTNGTTYDLGSFAAGTEIEFGLYVSSIDATWYDGPASRNSDGVVHAYMVNDYEGLSNTTYVGFEDAPNGTSDFNYIDEVYAFTGVSASTAPDGAATLALMGLALSGLAAVSRRRK